MMTLRMKEEMLLLLLDFFFLFGNKLSYFVHVFIFCCVKLVPSFMFWYSLETEMINFVNIIG